MTMEFKDNEAIYMQIANNVSESVLLGKWQEGMKIPSVRNMASEMQVNPNTVIRTYEFLESRDIIYTKRGLGFFVREGAVKRIRTYIRDTFLETELPDIFKSMMLLDIDVEEVITRHKLFKEQIKANSK